MEKKINEILQQPLNKIIISNQINKNSKYRRIIIREIILQNNKYYQFEKYTQKQVFHENLTQEECLNKIIDYMKEYRQLDAFCQNKNYSIQLSKKGKVFIHEKNVNNQKIIPITHNRKKNYLIPEGEVIDPLVDLGIFNKEGKVINSMYDKYKQINRFIEMIDDCLDDNITHLNIIDFGCGKSYLTFILYYYLVYRKNISVSMIGLDLKEDIIHHCNEIAKKYHYDHLKFVVGDINGYQSDVPVDMVISLHACDTATDYAIYNAICWNAKMIFSVPCCQHEINQQMETNEFSLFTKYGLLKERMAAILTDEIRANLLESESYKVQVLEFIDMSHSPKNVLLRCIKSSHIREEKKQKALQEVEKVIEEFHLEPTLYKLLKKRC
ncbi:MAG: class I SAM-dependent methyltransferase [Traorella sp.]